MQQTLAPFHLEPVGEETFRADVALRVLGELPLVSANGVGYCGKRGRYEIARSSDHFYVAALHAEGAASLTARGEEKKLAPGDIFILDSMHDVAFGMERPYHHLLVKLPKAMLETRLTQPETLHGSVLPHGHPLARLFAGYLAAGFRAGSDLPPNAAAIYARHLIDLIAEAFRPCAKERPMSGEAVRAARLASVKAELAANPSLGLSAIAFRQGVTPRYVQMLFEAEGTTFTSFALQTRLERAWRLLTDARYADLTVAAIAYEAGFGDLSHFYRQFRHRYSASPSDIRAEAMKARES